MLANALPNTSIFLVGAALIAVGVAAATLIVWRDLAPVARISGWRRLALIVGLGGGVFAFIFKFAIIEALTHGGVEHLTAAPPPIARAEPDDSEPGQITWGKPRWKALPSVAPAPADNPTTAEKAALGARLFRDPLLSVDGTVSCASCHDLDHGGGSEARSTSRGVGGQIGKRKAPRVYNAAFQTIFFWDGRARSLEDQATGPIGNPIEMGNPDLDAVAARVAADPSYAAAFAAAFGPDAPIDISHVAMAIAAFERTLVTADTPYDRFVRGDASALTAQQLRGMALFETAGCVNCHAGPNFSNASMLAPAGMGSGMRMFPAHPSPYTAQYRLADDSGAAAPGRPGVWRAPSLRNVALAAPYFHNGSVDDLTEAVRVMAKAQLGRVISDNPRVEPVVSWSADSGRLMSYTPSTLTEADIADITAFLRALTSERLAAQGQ
jgi:cytochrome c peroxidase